MLRVFVAEHRRGAAGIRFGAADPTARLIQAEQFGGAAAAVEIDPLAESLTQS